MNLPNKLTLTRILLVPVFMIFVSLGQYITPSYNPRYYLPRRPSGPQVEQGHRLLQVR